MIKSYCAYVYGILVWEASKGIKAATRRPPNNKSLTKKSQYVKRSRQYNNKNKNVLQKNYKNW